MQTINTEHAIIRDLDQAWSDLIRIEQKLVDDRFYSWEDRHNSVGYMETALRTIAARRADLDAHRAQRAEFDAHVARLSETAVTVGDPALAAVAYCVYGPAALPMPVTFTALDEPTARGEALADDRYWADLDWADDDSDTYED